MPLRVRPYSTILSITIAHTQIEATSSPSMTVFTIQCAFQNKVKIERSEEASGNADCARSAEFIGYPFASPRMQETGRLVAGLSKASSASVNVPPFRRPPTPGVAQEFSRPPPARCPPE